MPWTIYSTGDGAFLAQILNSVAMLVNSGSLAQIAAIGLLLGVVFAVIQGVIQNGRGVPFGGVVVAFVLYFALFTPRVSVTVYDTYTWSGRSVDNVPLGLAASGTLLSHIGYDITQLFETAYTLPGMLQTGFGTPLEALLSVRKVGLGTANNLGGNDNFLQTLSNYIHDCTQVGINLSDLDPAKMVQNPNVWAAMDFPSDLYTTRTHLPGDPQGGQQRTCNQAYTAISDQWGQRLNAWNSYLSDHYDITDARSVIQGSLDNMVQVGLSADQYMENALIANVLRDVRTGNYHPGSYTADLITTQATEQARVQFAGEASMFARFARPLMTFVEGFVYSLTPFMVFVIGFGLAGIKLIGRYLMMLMWVQLWMPIMSVANLFVEMSYTHKMDALNHIMQSSGSPLSPLSLLGMNSLQHQAADWVAVSGNLVAAAPALSLAVLYGGAYALVNLAHRLNPQDMVDETQAAPTLEKNPGVLALSSAQSFNPTAGRSQSGADAVIGSVDVSNVAGRMMSSATSRLQTAQSGYSDTVNSGISRALSSGAKSDTLEKLGSSVSYGNSTAFGHTMRRAEAFAKSHGYSQSQTNALKGAMVASASGAWGAPEWAKALTGGELKGSLSGQGSSEAGSQSGASYQKDLRNLLEEAGSKEVRDSFSNTTTGAAEHGHSQSYADIANQQDSQAYGKSLSRLRSATKNYQSAQSLQGQSGYKQSLGLVAVGNKLAGNKSAMDRINNYRLADPGFDRRMRKNMAGLEQTGDFGDPSVAANERRYQAAAAVQALSVGAFDPSASDDQRMDRQNVLSGLLQSTGLLAGGSAPPGVDAAANRGVSDHVQGEADGMVSGARAATGAARGRATGRRPWVDQVDDAIKKIDPSHGGEARGAVRQLWDKQGSWKRQYAGDSQLSNAPGQAALPGALRDLQQAPKPPAAAGMSGLVESLKAGLGNSAFAKAFTDADNKPMSIDGVAAKALTYSNPLSFLYSKTAQARGRQQPASAQHQAMQQRFAANSGQMRAQIYQRGLGAGLTDLQANMLADAGVSASKGELDRMLLGKNVAQAVRALGNATHIAPSKSYRADLEDKYYGKLYSHYLNQYGGDQRRAKTVTNAVFNNIANAGVAGLRASEYVNPLSAFNAASGDAARKR